MEIGVSLSPTKSGFAPILFPGALDMGLQAAHDLGYDGVELSLLDSTRIDRSVLKAKLAELQLKVFAIATGQSYITDGLFFYSPDPSKRQKVADRVRHHIDLAAELKSRVIIGGIRGKLDSPGEEGKLNLSQEGEKAIASCADHAQACGVILLLEPINRYETNVVNTLEEGLRMMEQLGHSCLKLLPDTFHMNIEEGSIPSSIAQAGKAIGYVHFADSNRLAPGWGHLDFAGILEALHQIQYHGPIGIEVLPKPNDRATAEQAIRYVRMLVDQRENRQQ